MDEKLEFFVGLDINENISTVIDEMKVGIHLSSELAENRYGQIMVVAAVNLLSRIFTNIVLSIPEDDVTMHFNGEKVHLDTYLQNIAIDARAGNEDKISLSSDLRGCVAIISVGEFDSPINSDKIVYIAANGWLASISPTPISIGDIHDKNPCGAVAAACLGIAETVKIAFKNKISKPTKLNDSPLIFSTLDYKVNAQDQVNPPINCLTIDSTTLFGVGSVGSSLLYTMSFLHDVYGKLNIVDTDKGVESRNLLRYGYLTVGDILKFKGEDKVTWAQKKLSKDCPNLMVDMFSCNIKDYTNQFDPYEQAKLAISAVDNVPARRDITDFLAKRTINAGTGDVRFTISRHGFNNDLACLYCLYLDIANPPANRYQQYAEMTKLSSLRVYELIENNGGLEEADFEIMRANNVVGQEIKEKIVGKPLLSFIHERFYGQMPVTDSNNERVITLGYVTVMTGCLLFAEMVKELSGLQSMWEGTLYEQDLLMLPNELSQFRLPNNQGFCLCQNSFRRKIYNLKYPK